MSYYFKIISGEAKGLLAIVGRGLLWLLSKTYAVIVGVRNWIYDAQWGVTYLERPTISVGNLTTGGTGKSPFVSWLADALNAEGYKVCIISRGYKGDVFGNDELKLVSEQCPHAICVASPNRVAAGEKVIAEYGVDTILLDDGFQHRRLGRLLDIVMIDATRPWGYGHILPRGLLRESVAGISRAGLVILTRMSQILPDQLLELKRRIQELAPEVPVVACDHRAISLLDSQGQTQALDRLLDGPLLAISGVGNPEGFERTLSGIGAKMIATLRFPDHHRYRHRDCERISECVRKSGCEMLVTTEKDLVKLRELNYNWPVPLCALQIRIDFVGEGGRMVMQAVKKVMTGDLNE